MTAEHLAHDIRRRFGCVKPSQIALLNGLQVVFNEWFPATYGEFYADRNLIIVNRRAPFEAERIIAHELGHFFVRDRQITLTEDEEAFCERFAVELLKNSDEND